MAEIKKTKVGNTGKNEEIKEPAKASAIEPAEKPAETVKAAVKDYYDKNGIAYDKEKFAPGSCPTCGEKLI